MRQWQTAAVIKLLRLCVLICVLRPWCPKRAVELALFPVNVQPHWDQCCSSDSRKPLTVYEQFVH